MRALLLLGVASLALTACKFDGKPNPPETAQLTSGAPFQLALAPSFDALPAPSQPVPIAYAPPPVAQQYWDDAYLMNQNYYDQPPAYFNYGGATPLVWNQATNTGGSMITRIVEALIGGGQREYYYQPGYDTPFFVRDPQYAYAYDPSGRLVSVYDPLGQPLAQNYLTQQQPYASRYFLRADTLRQAAVRAALQRLAPDVWATQRQVLIRDVREPKWREVWMPGDNRSPVAVQRLAEVRARKAARDEAHDIWKAKTVTGPPPHAAKVVEAAKAEHGPPAHGPDKHAAPPQKEHGPAKKADEHGPAKPEKHGEAGGGHEHGKGGGKHG
jgi:hypothetical protein